VVLVNLRAEAEVGELDIAFEREKDVVRLDVAVDNTL